MSVVWYFNDIYYDNLLKLLCIPVLRGGVPHIGIDHRWLTINFELKFFVLTCFHMIWGFQNPLCLRLSVHTPGPRKRNRPGFANISPTLVIHTSHRNINGKVFTNTNTTALNPKTLNEKNSKLIKLNEFCLYREKRYRPAPGFVDISPTLVIGASIERCSRVLVYYSIESLKPKKLNFKKIEIDEIEFCPLQNITRVSVPRRNPRIRNRPGCVDVTSTLVIDALIERSSRVLHHGNTKIWNFSKKVRNWILTCAEELKSP